MEIIVILCLPPRFTKGVKCPKYKGSDTGWPKWTMVFIPRVNNWMIWDKLFSHEVLWKLLRNRMAQFLKMPQRFRATEAHMCPKKIRQTAFILATDTFWVEVWFSSKCSKLKCTKMNMSYSKLNHISTKEQVYTKSL